MSADGNEIPSAWRRASISPPGAEVDVDEAVGNPSLERQNSSTSSIPREWRRASLRSVEKRGIEFLQVGQESPKSNARRPGGASAPSGEVSPGVPEMWKSASAVPPGGEDELSPKRDSYRLKRESVKISKKMGGIDVPDSWLGNRRESEIDKDIADTNEEDDHTKKP
mmetsp:Transcript_21428/g.44653  ORF Transcript_21428/g.44653 Transcript_21428/m.44653 type:complete len:167 (-) Transcript_21428:98-598(-)|eukprot:CAMPEP_0197559652 /NCGR_PEP_ID=MMETSP1320-20131121/21643_1 /TAXON_ID=91990 /ORGANISM="Bolidomonas sp., Strain RCC2347" /LENGTH=166 /DNA_ID=CAMNT_0043121115 /DNA_START=216 /DNA_END=716 /DNA_ORIENTATION=-